MTLAKQDAKLFVSDLITELTGSASNGSCTASGVQNCFRNAAIEHGTTIAQLPVNLWMLFHQFGQLSPYTVFGLKEVIQKVRAT